MVKNFHNGTNVIAKPTIFLGQEILEFFMAPTVKKHTLVSWGRRFQTFNLERKGWVIEKFWKCV
jgi:hypothetical protein